MLLLREQMHSAYLRSEALLYNAGVHNSGHSGFFDPTVLVSMGNQSESFEIGCKQAISPQCEELIEIKYTIREGQRKPNVNVLVYDYNDGTILCSI